MDGRLGRVLGLLLLLLLLLLLVPVQRLFHGPGFVEVVPLGFQYQIVPVPAAQPLVPKAHLADVGGWPFVVGAEAAPGADAPDDVPGSVSPLVG